MSKDKTPVLVHLQRKCGSIESKIRREVTVNKAGTENPCVLLKVLDQWRDELYPGWQIAQVDTTYGPNHFKFK